MYIVMEYCSGGDLYAMFKAANTSKSSTVYAPLPMNMVRGVMFQVAQALGYLHGNSIMHRDLKMSNILLQPAGPASAAASDTAHPATQDCAWSAKLGDFGLSVRIEDPLEEHFTVCGTPHYISPEMAAKRPHTLSADWWSFGCLLYALLFDASPVRRSSNSTTSRSKNAPPSSEKAFTGAFNDNLNRLSPAWKSLLQSLLSLDPQRRPNAEEVLRASCWGEAVHVAPPSAQQRGGASSSNGNSQGARASDRSSVSTAQHSRHGHGSSVAQPKASAARSRGSSSIVQPAPQQRRSSASKATPAVREQASKVKVSSSAAHQQAVAERLFRGQSTAAATAAAASHRRRAAQSASNRKSVSQRPRAVIERPSPLVASPGRIPARGWRGVKPKQKRSPHRPPSSAGLHTGVQATYTAMHPTTSADMFHSTAPPPPPVAEPPSDIGSAEGVSLMHVPTPVPMPGQNQQGHGATQDPTPEAASLAQPPSDARATQHRSGFVPSERSAAVPPPHTVAGAEWKQRPAVHRHVQDIWGETSASTQGSAGADSQSKAALPGSSAQPLPLPPPVTAAPFASEQQPPAGKQQLQRKRAEVERPPSYDDIVVPKTVEPSFLGGLSDVYEGASTISEHAQAPHSEAPATGTSTSGADNEPMSSVTQSTAAGPTPLPRSSRVPPPSTPPRPLLHPLHEVQSPGARSSTSRSVYDDAAEAVQEAQRWLQAIPPRWQPSAPVPTAPAAKAIPRATGAEFATASADVPASMQAHATVKASISSSHSSASGGLGHLAAAEKRKRRQHLLERARRQQMLDEARSGTQATWIKQSYTASADNGDGGGETELGDNLQPAAPGAAGQSFMGGVALGSSFLSGTTSQNSSHLMHTGPRVVSVPAALVDAPGLHGESNTREHLPQAKAVEAAVPAIELHPLQQPFAYSSQKALVQLEPEHGWVWGVFHHPARWFSRVLKQQEVTIRRLEMEQQCSTRLEAARVQGKLDLARRTRQGVLALLEATRCIHLRVHAASGEQPCAVELALSGDAPPTSLTPQQTFPSESERYAVAALPKWSQKLYKYLQRLVQAVKARTPLLVLVGSSGRTAMMANLPRPLVACKLMSGWRVQYDLGSQRMTLKQETTSRRGAEVSSLVLSLSRSDCESTVFSAAARTSADVPEMVLLCGQASESTTPKWRQLDDRESDSLLPVVHHAQHELFSVLRLWERVLSTRDALEAAQATATGGLQPGDKALLKSLKQLPIVLKQPAAAAAAARPPAVARVRRRRQGGVKASFDDGALLRVAADSATAHFEPAAHPCVGTGSHGGPPESVDMSFASASSSGSAASARGWVSVAALPQEAATYMEGLRNFLKSRKGRS